MRMRARWAERSIAASADGWRSIHELRAYHLAAAAPFARFDRGRHRALAPQPPWTGGRSALGSSARRRAAHRIGYVLLLLFNHEHPAWVVLLLIVMLVVAGATAARRVEHGPPRNVLFPRAIAAIGAGTLVVVLPVFDAVVPLHPWYEARYLVPISGTMLSNAM